MQTSLNLNVEIQKINDTSTNQTNMKQNNKTEDKDCKFNEYLQKEKKVNESTNNDSVNKREVAISKNDSESTTNSKELEETKETDEKVEKLSKDDILECLQVLVNAINQANLAKENNMNLNEKVDKISSSISDSLIKAINLKGGLNESILGNVTSITANIKNNSNEDLDPASLINNLLELLNSNNASELLDKKGLTIAQSLLNQLGLKLENNTDKISNIDKVSNVNSTILSSDLDGNKVDNVAAEDKSFLQDLISEVKDKVNTLLDSKADKEILSNSINRLIISTNNTKSMDAKDTNNILEKANTVANEVSSYAKSSENSGNESKKDSNSNLSKDDKILKSILGEDSKETPKVSMFTANAISNGKAEAIKNVQVVNKETLAADVVKSVKYMTSNDIKEMIVKVNPGNLGEITIKLIEEDGNMKLNIKASAKETYNLLSQQTAEIKNHLSNQNIKIHDVNIGVYDDDTTFFKGGEFQNHFAQGENRKDNSESNESRGSYMEDEDIQIEEDEISNINMLA